MGLANGTRLGPYAITTPLGAGGMGEVYQATDTRLGRTVAIKVLPAHVAADPALRQRFEREARAISSLNHPHICTVHDVGSQDGVDFLVMEHLEGETLAARLAKGAMPVAQALQTAIQIADALDKAHRHGIVHRDLKPGNVMLTKSGAKLLDFGLAKSVARTLLGSRGEPDKARPTVGPSAAPTITAPLTSAGSIVGTFQYMAPEQLEGQEADARTDIFAFGAVLYEMLTGRKAFEGKSQPSLIAAIMHGNPAPISSLQPVTPPALDRLVSTCLAKDPDDRWQTMRDVVRELTWIAESGAQASATPAAVTAPSWSRSLVLAGAVLVAVVAGVASLGLFRSGAVAPELHLDIATPPGGGVSFALSPDGQQITFAAESEGQQRLWLRTLSTGIARPLPGTEGPTYPFWSPDGRSIGFFADGKLKRIDVDGGLVQELATAPTARGGAWHPDGTIVFSPLGTGTLWRVSASGGEATVLTTLSGPEQTDHRFPQFLPDGRHYLYYARGTNEGRGVYLADMGGGTARRLFDADAGAVFASTGHLLYVRGGTLFAQPFDVTQLELTGVPFAVDEGVLVNGVSMPALSSSAAGTIAWRKGATQDSSLIWFDRSGRELANTGASGNGPQLSPDERRIALNHTVSANLDVWLLETEGNRLSRFTSGQTIDIAPVWSPDGSRIVFQSTRGSAPDLYLRSTAADGAEEVLLASPEPKVPLDWSPDGRFLLYKSQRPSTGNDVWALPVGTRQEPFEVLGTKADEDAAQFSPDGKWMAYHSNESGRYEVYVQPFPGPGTRIPISTQGGANVRWRKDGQELFYIGLDRRMMAVPLRATPDHRTLAPGTPVALFATRAGLPQPNGVGREPYAVTADGQRFLIAVQPDAPLSPISLVLNWKASPSPAR